MNPLRLSILGAKGRMGQALIACAEADPGLEVISTADAGDDLALAMESSDAAIDFSHASVTARIAELAAERVRTLVIGTTGQDDAARQAVSACAQRIPVVFAPNFSVGVNTLFWLVRHATEILGPGFDLEVIEMHHRLKKDAPSGTARRLAEILAGVRGLTYEEGVCHGREGMLGERPDAEIGMHALRGGDVVGDHTVVFAAAGERVELSHKASSRETFALGALRAAKWAASRQPGLYSMEDVLGLSGK
jgi:4-hydroxy-tetrahydrodipicolinate reductase